MFVAERLEATLFIFGQPGLIRLARHTELGRDLGDGETLFQIADVHWLGPPP
jgi:hypothetical protein